MVYKDPRPESAIPESKKPLKTGSYTRKKSQSSGHNKDQYNPYLRDLPDKMPNLGIV